MRTRAVSLTLLTWTLALAIPATAGVVYNNGPINGTENAYPINFGAAAADTFTVSGGNMTITGIAFGAWVDPGATLLAVEVSLTSQPFGGQTYFDAVVDVIQSNCSINLYMYDVCTETATFQGPNLADGTYWLNLQNAIENAGGLVYWDENDGVGCTSPGCPSQAMENEAGTIPWEAFTIYGNAGSTPEPSSLLLFASGILGAGGLLRRRLVR